MCSRLQLSEESVSSVEPSLSTSILLLWWMFFLGEAFLCTSLRAPTALPLLLLPGLTEIWAILDSVKEGKKCREEVNRAKCSEAPNWLSSIFFVLMQMCISTCMLLQFVQFLVHFWVNEQLCLTR